MSLPVALFNAFLKTYPPSVISKGLELYQRPTDEEIVEELMEELREGVGEIRVPIAGKNKFEGVMVDLDWGDGAVSAYCECSPFFQKGNCKHIVAAIHEILHLQRVIDAEDGEPKAPAPAPVETQVAAPAPGAGERFVLKEFNSAPARAFAAIDWSIGHRRSAGDLRQIVKTKFDETAGIWDFTNRQSKTVTHYPRIEYDLHQHFTLSCTCEARRYNCLHLLNAASYLYDRFGPAYFEQFRDYSAERAAALKKLGIHPDDPLASAVSITTDSWGNTQIKVPDWLWHNESIERQMSSFIRNLGLTTQTSAGSDDAEAVQAITPGFVFQTSSFSLPFGFELAVINATGGKFSKMSLNSEDRLAELKAALPADMYAALISITQAKLNKALDEIGSVWKLPHSSAMIRPGDKNFRMLHQRYANALETLWPLLSDPATAIYSLNETTISRRASTPIQLDPTPVTASVRITRHGDFLELRPGFRYAGGEPIDAEISIVANGLLLRSTDRWFLPDGEKTRELLMQFPAGFLRVAAPALPGPLQTLLPALRSRYDVELAKELQPEIRSESPQNFLQLGEQGGRNLVLTPKFRYGSDVFSFTENPLPVMKTEPGAGWYELQRDADAERTFVETIRGLHPSFETSRNLQRFAIPFADALRDAWYQKTMARLAELGVEVAGLETLEHFRYSPHGAQVSVSNTQSENGIDWFDVLIEISFGDQQVTLKEVRKALMAGQTGVRLKDGSIGLLPEEFVAQYGALLKLGKEKGEGTLRLNKLHFTLVDALENATLSGDLKAELAAKKAALQNVERIRTEDIPPSVNAELRPYQLAGFQWLQTLDKLGWGGCLADDMGLGKTLQTITFMQYLKDHNRGATQLVVCPTSLIYNWQSELDKFAPELRYHIHYGASRVWNAEVLDEVDIVITTYGIVRSDLEQLLGIRWHYVILDESQAIKNPEAQTTRAVQALQAQNRLCLSGTPLQNNTFDLYAQFEFLNPGLLGSRDFFRSEFATPIDKQGSEPARATLRKMLAPFMLRRTKEQVAKDLPDKTEVTLWCEMEPEQRAVYDEYRRYYRDSLLQRIDEEGMQGSSIYILEALLRMRQLCDHPQLVKNDAVTTTASIKLDELLREIRENAGGRKVLVFSQFTEMLAQIRSAFKAEKITHVYLDGKTPAAKRKLAVEKFQDDPAVQVFLISLKAGGVGLNLTAAEYVYIVDPWWNPAVEAQAIDRTHRIGQHNKIVAYRMICKDTVEEKVMLLQSRKRALADGLVTEDAGFVKKLTREDVAFLLE